MRKTLSFILLCLIIATFAFWVFLPNLIINYVEENDLELIGREVSIGDLNFSVLDGSVELNSFQLYEKESDTAFFHFDKLNLKLKVWSLLSKEVHLESFSLEDWEVRVIQKGNRFNFDDLISNGQSDEDVSTKDVQDPWHFYLSNIELEEGRVHYRSILNPLVILDSIHFSLPYFSDTSTSFSSSAQFNLSSGGNLHANTVVNYLDSSFQLGLGINDVNLKIIHPYMRPVIHFQDLNGMFASNLSFQGSLSNSNELDLSGDIMVTNFNLIDPNSDTVLELDEFRLSIDTVQFDEAVYKLDSIYLHGLDGMIELSDSSNTFSNLVNKNNLSGNSTDLSDDEVVEYENPFLILFNHIKGIVQSYDKSSYRLNHFSFDEAEFQVTDFSTNVNDFHYTVSDLEMSAEGLRSKNESMLINFSGVLDESGKFYGYIRPYTQNPKDFDLELDIEGSDLSPFAAYTIDYVNLPIESGWMEYDMDIEVKDQYLTSSNVIEVNEMHWGKKSETKPVYRLPIKLATSLLKDKDGKIIIDVPVQGNLDDPKFKMSKVFWMVIKNLIIKAANAPLEILSNIFDFKPKEVKEIRYEHLARKISKKNQKKVDKLIKVLDKKQDLNIDFVRVTKVYYELEEYALNEMKYRFLYPDTEVPEIGFVKSETYQELLHFDEKDSSFNAFIYNQLETGNKNISLRAACLELVGEEIASKKMDRLGNYRKQDIIDYFQSSNIDSTRLRFSVLPPDSLTSHGSEHIYRVDFWTE